ncbi:MAG: hypothetical protein RL662_1599 [Bacteroidota bacterium]|jgi:hypothetical protein
MKKNLLLFILFCSNVIFVSAQALSKDYEHLLQTPKNYVVSFANSPVVIDGNINDAGWEQAVWTDYFEDIEGDLKPKPYYKTRAKMLWDEKYLYIAAQLEDPHVWANLTKHDEIVFYDNDFEVFIDPENTTHRYFEYEINAMNTIFDLFLPKPYRTGSGALIGWDSNHLKHAVHVYGSLNNASDTDTGWTVELAIPFQDIAIGNHTQIPTDGDIWRLNFSRVQWDTEIVDGKYLKKKGMYGKSLPEHNWVWSPQGVINMHLPERWGYIQFSKKQAKEALPTFQMPYSQKQRQQLWLIYYKQKKYKETTGFYAKTLKDLDLKQVCMVDGKTNRISMESSKNQFFVIISDSSTKAITINDEGYVN